MLSVSVHPDLDPDEVTDAMAEWLQQHEISTEDAAISPVMRSQIGPVI
jgi:hypothetical protein